MRKNRILILTSTYPRWENDRTPQFVKVFSSELAKKNKIIVLAPHFKNAETTEKQGRLFLRRARYSPTKYETVFYDGGAESKYRNNPSYYLKVLLYVLSVFFWGLYYIYSKKITIINAHWIIPQGVVGVLLKLFTRKKLIVTVHGTDIFSFNQKFLVEIKKFVLSAADQVVVNSSVTKQACESLVKREYQVTPMGTDTDKFYPLNKNNENHKFKILFVGRIIKEKGLIYLLKAVKIAQEKLGKDNITLTVIGEGPQLSEFKKYVEKYSLETVQFLGWKNQDELNKYYNNADLFIGPSVKSESGTQEAFGLVFVEALAAGTPVIGTKIGGIKDIISDDVNGYLVDERSPQQLAEKIIYLRENPQVLKRISKNSRKYVEINYSWGAVIQKYEEIFCAASQDNQQN